MTKKRKITQKFTWWMAIASTYMNADAFWTHFSQHNRIFKTQKANISVSVYRPQGTDVSQICYYYCPLKMPTRGNQVVCVTFIVVIKVPHNPDLQLNCDMLHNRFVQTLYIQAFCCAHRVCVVVCNFVLSLLLKFGSLKSRKTSLFLLKIPGPPCTYAS